MDITELNKMQTTASYFKKHFSDLYEIIQKLPPEKFQEKIYWYIHNLTDYPRCIVCGNPTTFLDISQGYRTYCSCKCLNSDPAKKERTKATCIERYGGPAPACSKHVKEKAKSTCIEKYGTEYAMQSQEVQSKAIQTISERYGVEWSGSIPGRSKKMQETCIERYGGIGVDSELLKQKVREACPDDSPNPQFILDLLDERNIEYELNNFADIWIPSLKFAIELNGTYYHSTLLKSRTYHINKFKNAQEKGIRLLTFWSDQIYNHPEIVKSMIMTKLGKSDKTVYARKCIIREVSSKAAGKFLEANHIQGSTPTSIRYGLYFENELVALMTFSKNTACQGSKNNHEWVLNRFCNKINIRVIGAAGKLLNHFIKTHNPDTIVSFSHNDISDGHLYEVLGFESDHKINTSYYYIKGNKRWHRSAFTKAGIVRNGWRDKIDNTWTEKEVMQEQHFLCIYDSGTQKWIWTKKARS